MYDHTKRIPVTRREALRRVGGGFGMMAFAGMLGESMARAGIGPDLATTGVSTATSGMDVHRMLVPSDDPADQVHGVVFAITPEELQAADSYETADYKRVSLRLLSGSEAWVYVSAHHPAKM